MKSSMLPHDRCSTLERRGKECVPVGRPGENSTVDTACQKEDEPVAGHATARRGTDRKDRGLSWISRSTRTTGSSNRISTLPTGGSPICRRHPGRGTVEPVQIRFVPLQRSWSRQASSITRSTWWFSRGARYAALASISSGSSRVHWISHSMNAIRTGLVLTHPATWAFGRRRRSRCSGGTAPWRRGCGGAGSVRTRSAGWGCRCR